MSSVRFRNRRSAARPAPWWAASVLASILASACLWAQVAIAAPQQEAGAESPAQALPTVQTSLQRGTFMPYKRLNELLTTLRTEGEGLFVSRFRLRASDKTQPLPANAKLALMDDDRTIDIPITANGRFELPTFPEGEARQMELGTNLAKGTTQIQLNFDITTPPDRLDMATVRRVVRVGQHLRGELLPWYLRWMVPQIDGVVICGDKPDWQLEWPEGGQVLALPLDAEKERREPETDKDKPSRPCTSLSGEEQWPGNARLQSPAGNQTKLYIRLRQTRAS